MHSRSGSLKVSSLCKHVPIVPSYIVFLEILISMDEIENITNLSPSTQYIST